MSFALMYLKNISKKYQKYLLAQFFDVFIMMKVVYRGAAGSIVKC